MSSDISNVMDARSQHFANTKSRLEIDISILANSLQFLDSSISALHIKQVLVFAVINIKGYRSLFVHGRDLLLFTFFLLDARAVLMFN
jgi:hypothetical protein